MSPNRQVDTVSLRQEVELGLDSNPGPEDTTQNGNMSLACFFPETISIPFPCLLHSGWSHCSGSTSGTLWGPRLPVTSLPPVHRVGLLSFGEGHFPTPRTERKAWLLPAEARVL